VITAISVALDHEEYSKYDPALAIFNADITTNGSPGDILSWSLERLDGFGVVIQGNIILTGPTAHILVDLRTVDDVDGINWTTAGQYQLRVIGDSVTVLTPFCVSIISVDEMRKRWIYGVSLESSDLLAPVVPLRLLTGITYIDSSQTMTPGAYVLQFTPANGLTPAFITMDGGSAVFILPTGIQDIVLISECTDAWIKLRVDPTKLPTTLTTETLVLDRAKMDDDAIRKYVTLASQTLESYLEIGIEPRVSMTNLLWLNKNKPYIDSITQPVSWQRPYNIDTWLNFHLPLRRLLKVYSIEGYFNSSQSVAIPVGEWETHDEYTGMITFIPKSGGALVTWQSIQATFFQFMFARDIVQDFWHYDVAHGLRSLNTPANAPVREAIAKKAACDILLQAGSALKAGISSESVSRDGVSESTSYTQSAMYGIYSHVIIPYQEWLEGNLPSIKRRLSGISFVTL
jgi:hypothetical protein